MQRPVIPGIMMLSGDEHIGPGVCDNHPVFLLRPQNLLIDGMKTGDIKIGFQAKAQSHRWITRAIARTPI